jgi:hypothetical protein
MGVRSGDDGGGNGLGEAAPPQPAMAMTTVKVAAGASRRLGTPEV